MTTTTRLTCCVCGADAGRWQQHWNRDTGYGICATCAREQAKRETPDRMRSLYGTAGLNYEATDPITAYYTDRAKGHHAAKAP